jgi:hypothetical protein
MRRDPFLTISSIETKEIVRRNFISRVTHIFVKVSSFIANPRARYLSFFDPAENVAYNSQWQLHVHSLEVRNRMSNGVCNVLVIKKC